MAINDTSVDCLNLVEECVHIGVAIDNANKDVHDPKTEYDDKKVYQKHLRGKIWLDYKTGKRTVEGLEGKITDKAVEAAVDADEEYLEACRATNGAYHSYMVADDYASAMEGKKKSLELLSKYALAGWFGDLKIANIDSITNFANNGNTRSSTEASTEREALRESRRRRAGKEEEEIL